MKKIIIVFGILFLAGCGQQSTQPVVVLSQPVVSQTSPAPVQNDNQLPDLANQSSDEKPQITSATFDGNGVVIQGKNLSGTYVAFIHPASSNGETLCREMITPNCVLQKTVSTDTTIKFISNWIGGEGSYQIYVENQTTGESNKIKMPIPASKN